MAMPQTPNCDDKYLIQQNGDKSLYHGNLRMNI